MSARWISTSANVCPGSEKALRRPPRAPMLSISGLSHPYHDSLTVARVDTTHLLRPRLAVLSRKSLARLPMRTHDLRVPANAFCGTVNDGMLGPGLVFVAYKFAHGFQTRPLRSSTLLSSLPSPPPLDVGPLATRHSTRPTRRHRQCRPHLIARSSTAFIDLLNHSPLRRCRYRRTLAAPESMDLGVMFDPHWAACCRGFNTFELFLTFLSFQIVSRTHLAVDAPRIFLHLWTGNLPELSPWDLFPYRLRSFLLAPTPSVCLYNKIYLALHRPYIRFKRPLLRTYTSW
ncbi:hypothetical protein B0H13DRAFT_2317960 [Mycena leptocephala]|nr:hypothetical protein B0H13DRAFT_2317960 [Mycena leptocephala]